MKLSELLSTFPNTPDQYIKVFEWRDYGGGDAYDKVIFDGYYNSRNLNTERGEYLTDVKDILEVVMIETRLTKDGAIAMDIYC